jgi:hypothetical protein
MSTKCHNCDKRAMYQHPQNAAIPLCLDCYAKMMDVSRSNLEVHVAQLNYAAEQAEFVSGMPGLIPRFRLPAPQPVFHGVTLNHIDVRNSNVGVVNAGTIGSIDNAIGVMKAAGDVAGAAALKSMTEAIARSQDVSDAQRSQLLELIGILAIEAGSPRSQRKSSAMAVVIESIVGLLKGTSTLATEFSKVRDAITELFSK